MANVQEPAAEVAVLDGVELIVFTGGIGEHDPTVRAAICGGLSWIGISLDGVRNLSADNPINASLSRCKVLMLASQEDDQIARHTRALSRSIASGTDKQASA